MLFACVAAGGICFCLQGLHYWYAGVESPFFWRGGRPRRLKPFYRISYGLICIGIGVFLVRIVAIGTRNSLSPIGDGQRAMAALLVGPGVLFLVRPDMGLRLVGQSETLLSQAVYPLVIARVVGGLMLLGGLLFITP